MARCNLGDGKSALFWTDIWHDSCLHQKLPHRVSFAKKTEYSVFEVIQQDFLQDLFHLPLSQPAYEEFLLLEYICNEVQTGTLNGNVDTWSYILGST
jgi:hypothetical protein